MTTKKEISKEPKAVYFWESEIDGIYRVQFDYGVYNEVIEVSADKLEDIKKIYASVIKE